MDHKKFYYIGTDILYQGHLVIMKDKSGVLFIQSTGSQLEWDTPEHALIDTKEVTSFNQEYRFVKDAKKESAEYATWKDIAQTDWDVYVINKPN